MAGKTKPKQLIAEAAKVVSKGKPVRKSATVAEKSSRAVARPKTKAIAHGTPIPVTFTETFDLDDLVLGELDMHHRDLTQLSASKIVEDLFLASSADSLFAGVGSHIDALTDAVAGAKRCGQIHLNNLKLELVQEAREWDGTIAKLRLTLTGVRLHGTEPMLPVIDAHTARCALEYAFNQPIAIGVTFAENNDYIYQVMGQFHFDENSYSGDDTEGHNWQDAPTATSPESAIIKLFYMVYEFVQQSNDHTVISASDSEAANAQNMNYYMTNVKGA